MKKITMILMTAAMLISCGRNFEFSPYTVISVENEEQREVADWFAWLFASPGGFVPMVVTDDSSADVILSHDPSLEGDSYRLDIDMNTIKIEASGISGFFYAFQTLRNMLPDEIDSVRHADSVKWTVPLTGVTEASGIDRFELVWQDDFNSFDESKWSKISRGPSDWRRHMSSNDSLYSVADGKLILRAVTNDGLEPSDTAEYLTGGVYTKDKFTVDFGKVEIRAKVGSGKSVWPALWMLPESGNWPDDGEIDIMEHLGYDEFVYQTVHTRYTQVFANRSCPKSYVTAPIRTDTYNVYSVEILPDSLVFLVNGERTLTYPRIDVGEDHRVQFPFGSPYYILMDMQIGGSWVGPADGSDLPVEMTIDWIRTYSLK